MPQILKDVYLLEDTYTFFLFLKKQYNLSRAAAYIFISFNKKTVG